MLKLSDAGFGREHDVSVTTLSRWRHEDGFEEAADILRELASISMYPSVMEALEKKAINGDVNAIRLWLQVHGKLEKKETESAVSVPKSLEDLITMGK